jgi:acyl-CoA hydrolase
VGQLLSAPLLAGLSTVAKANVIVAVAAPFFQKLLGRRSKHASNERQCGDSKVEETHLAEFDRDEM